MINLEKSFPSSSSMEPMLPSEILEEKKQNEQLTDDRNDRIYDECKKILDNSNVPSNYITDLSEAYTLFLNSSSIIFVFKRMFRRLFKKIPDGFFKKSDEMMIDVDPHSMYFF